MALMSGRVGFDGSIGGLRWGGGVDGQMGWDGNEPRLKGFGIGLERPSRPIRPCLDGNSAHPNDT